MLASAADLPINSAVEISNVAPFSADKRITINNYALLRTRLFVAICIILRLCTSVSSLLYSLS